MSGPNPQETWRRLQRTLQNAQQQGQKFGGGGNPRNALGGIVGLVVLGGGAVLLNNSLFNGSCCLQDGRGATALS